MIQMTKTRFIALFFFIAFFSFWRGCALGKQMQKWNQQDASASSQMDRQK